MHTPIGFISVICNGQKNGESCHINELMYEDFYDLKQLAAMGINITGFKITEVKILKITEELLSTLFYKTSDGETDFKEVKIIWKKKIIDFSKIILSCEYPNNPILNEKKKITC